MRAWMAPLGSVFGGAAALRVSLYDRGLLARTRLGSPVVSVGNIAVGGRGKTPLVELVAALLRDAGRPVAVLSRGYGGSFRGECLIVSDGRQVAAEAAVAGDEPVMLARALPGVVVAIGRDRAAVGRRVEQSFGPRIHVLDDGFQHLRLRRDLDLVCVDADDLRQRPLPAGALRERPSALRRADLVALGGDDEATAAAAAAELVRRLGAGRVLRVRREARGFESPEGAAVAAPLRPWLLTGIARPERVARDLALQGLTIAGHDAFADHHAFRREELAAVWRRAEEAGADAVVTTAKDAVRLPPAAREARSALPVLVFRVRCVVEDLAALRRRLLALPEET